MKKVYSNLTELVGKTPLVELNKLKKENKLNGNIIAKIEYFNPAGSVKDRIALSMIEKAENEGELDKDTVIIEPTSGNTGVGLAFIAAVKGYKLILTMPETMSLERRMIIKAYGAEIVLTEGKLGMKGAIDKAIDISKKYKKKFVPQQFKNTANYEIHRKTTGKEIFDDLDGQVDIVVAGVGTGGTITGVGKYLKSKNEKIKIVAVEPETSAVISGEKPGPHKIQGIGAGFIPDTLKVEVIDEVFKVKDEEALTSMKTIARLEGILVGISSGAVLFAAEKLALKEENMDKNIVAILPDTGQRYLSMRIFD